MELDVLKNNWKTISVNVDQNEFDIISATRRGIASPLDALKKRTKKQLMILPALFVFLIIAGINANKTGNSFFIWVAAAILPVMIIYHFFNLKLINGLETFNGPVKKDIEIKIRKLIKSNGRYLIATRFLFLLLIISSEVLLRYNRVDWIQGLDLLAKIDFPLRLCIYAAIFGFHYLISEYTFNKYFGQYLKKLKDVLAEMQ
ncbi:hypothetical protein RAH57_19415 [Chryseobacterium sp. CKR4-1]|jgi:hypothetical protein|uniref:hypothetical protein n=1 Tax=Chryseobacterium sp. CKR4-1 TaxID=3068896 RepID=UPI002796ABDC|nr:hypothetical protein [Chryseobacterium sp. CKR4-1]MDQ1806162.1 hypothetical protein [Chryseobacterium sp. CKR4-1]